MAKTIIRVRCVEQDQNLMPVATLLFRDASKNVHVVLGNQHSGQVLGLLQFTLDSSTKQCIARSKCQAQHPIRPFQQRLLVVRLEHWHRQKKWVLCAVIEELCATTIAANIFPARHEVRGLLEDGVQRQLFGGPDEGSCHHIVLIGDAYLAVRAGVDHRQRLLVVFYAIDAQVLQHRLIVLGVFLVVRKHKVYGLLHAAVAPVDRAVVFGGVVCRKHLGCCRIGSSRVRFAFDRRLSSSLSLRSFEEFEALRRLRRVFDRCPARCGGRLRRLGEFECACEDRHVKVGISVAGRVEFERAGA